MNGKFTALLLVVFLAASLLTVPSAADQSIAIGSLTRDRFGALPDSQILIVDGKQITKGAFIGEQRSRYTTALAALKAKAAAAFDAYKMQFLGRQQARVVAEKATSVSAFRTAALDSIRTEVAQLKLRWQTASPAERIQIEARAQQLLLQAQQARH